MKKVLFIAMFVFSFNVFGQELENARDAGLAKIADEISTEDVVQALACAEVVENCRMQDRVASLRILRDAVYATRWTEDDRSLIRSAISFLNDRT